MDDQNTYKDEGVIPQIEKIAITVLLLLACSIVSYLIGQYGDRIPVLG